MADKYVVSIDEVWDHLGTTYQAEYIFNYLKNKEIDAQTAIIEEKYIDKDYLLDYAGFYARSFEPIDRCTKRIHFFSGKFDQRYFRNVLTNYNENKIKKFGRYLGFIVLKNLKILIKILILLLGALVLCHCRIKLRNHPTFVIIYILSVIQICLGSISRLMLFHSKHRIMQLQHALQYLYGLQIIN